MAPQNQKVQMEKMDCLEFRRLKLSDPYRLVPEADAHRHECAGCRRFEEEIRQLDRRAREAILVDTPENLGARILLRQSLERNNRRNLGYWLGAAASVFAAILYFAFESGTATALETSIVRHLDWEQSRVTLAPVKDAEITEVMDSINARIVRNEDQRVLFAKACLVDNKLVAHLIVEHRGDVFTVLVMPNVSADGSHEFRIGDWQGVVAKQPYGSVAIVAEGPQHELEIRNALKSYNGAFEVAES